MSSPRPGFTGWVEQIAKTHSRRLTACAAQEGLSSYDAIDAVQEAFVTFLQLPQSRSLARDDDEAYAFLSTIVRNAARNARRRGVKNRAPEPLRAEEKLDESPGADELIAEAERHIAVLGCVGKLVEIQRSVVVLRLLEEMSNAEVARTLALEPGSVAVALFRAKAALRLCLRD